MRLLCVVLAFAVILTIVEAHDFSHYILQNKQYLNLSVCATTTETGVQLSLQGLPGRTIEAACWQTDPSAQYTVTACGGVAIASCAAPTSAYPGPGECRSNSAAFDLNFGVPPTYFTQCVNIYLTHPGQRVILNITGLDLDELGQIGVFSTTGDDYKARFVSLKACNSSLNDDVAEASVALSPLCPYSDTCEGCEADPCYPSPLGETVACCLTNSTLGSVLCPDASGCVDIPAQDCYDLNGTVVAGECPASTSDFAQFACERRACCRGYGCESDIPVAKCLEDYGTPLDIVYCPARTAGLNYPGTGGLNGDPCQLTGCCGGSGESVAVESRPHFPTPPPPPGMGDIRPACRSDLPAGACRLLGGAPLSSNCSLGMVDTRCACCLEVKKKCLQRIEKDGGIGSDGHGGFWAEMFAAPQDSGNNVGSTTSSNSQTSTNFDFISMGSMSGGSLVTMDGAKFDSFDDKKGTGSMTMNNVRFELREECETQCDECRNGTFVVLLINHCSVELENVRVVDTANGETIVKYVDVPKARNGYNGIKALFIQRCVACGLENEVEVTSPLEVNAGMISTIVGDAFCILHDSAEFEVNNAPNNPKPFEPFNPSSGSQNPTTGNGQGPLMGPSPPWAQRPGTLFGRVP